MSTVTYRQQEDVTKLVLTDLCFKLGSQPAQGQELEVAEEVISVDETEDDPTLEEEVLDPEEENDDKDETDKEEGPKSIECLVCGKKLSSVRSLQRHVESYHQNPHKCMSCGRFFRNEKELEQHAQSHLGYKCKICGKNYSTVDSLRSHRNRKHAHSSSMDQEPSETAVCDVCQKTFKNMDGLRIHLSKAHKDRGENTSENLNSDNSKEN